MLPFSGNIPNWLLLQSRWYGFSPWLIFGDTNLCVSCHLTASGLFWDKNFRNLLSVIFGLIAFYKIVSAPSSGFQTPYPDWLFSMDKTDFSLAYYCCVFTRSLVFCVVLPEKNISGRRPGMNLSLLMTVLPQSLESRPRQVDKNWLELLCIWKFLASGTPEPVIIYCRSEMCTALTAWIKRASYHVHLPPFPTSEPRSTIYILTNSRFYPSTSWNKFKIRS